MSHQQVIAGNVYDKYDARNIIVKVLMRGFYSSLKELLKGLSFQSALDTGCGEGKLSRLFLQEFGMKISTFVGIDISADILHEAVKNCPSSQFISASACFLPFRDDSFDLVLGNEILEHVSDPQTVLLEMKRVGSQFYLFSVPREPLWRLLNLCRFRYKRDFGNTPGHLQHWNKTTFIHEVSKTFHVIQTKSPLPWTMVLCRKQ